MDIIFRVPHAFYADSNPVDNAYVLRALLEGLIQINRAYLRRYPTPALYRSGVVYRRTVEWLSIPALYRQRFGDCKSLTAARIAEIRNQGIHAEPVFRWIRAPQHNGNNYHILVDMGVLPRKYEDPSKILGMGANENARF